MYATITPFDDLDDLIDERHDVDDLRVPLESWTDPAVPIDEAGAEAHIVRSID